MLGCPPRCSATSRGPTESALGRMLTQAPLFPPPGSYLRTGSHNSTGSTSGSDWSSSANGFVGVKRAGHRLISPVVAAIKKGPHENRPGMSTPKDRDSWARSVGGALITPYSIVHLDAHLDAHRVRKTPPARNPFRRHCRERFLRLQRGSCPTCSCRGWLHDHACGGGVMHGTGVNPRCCGRSRCHDRANVSSAHAIRTAAVIACSGGAVLQTHRRPASASLERSRADHTKTNLPGRRACAGRGHGGTDRYRGYPVNAGPTTARSGLIWCTNLTLQGARTRPDVRMGVGALLY